MLTRDGACGAPRRLRIWDPEHGLKPSSVTTLSASESASTSADTLVVALWLRAKWDNSCANINANSEGSVTVVIKESVITTSLASLVKAFATREEIMVNDSGDE